MENYHRIKPAEMELSSPQGCYITKEENMREIAKFVVSSALFFIPLFLKIKRKFHFRKKKIKF